MRARGENELVPLHFHVTSQVVDDIIIISAILFQFIRIKQITVTNKIIIFNLILTPYIVFVYLIIKVWEQMQKNYANNAVKVTHMYIEKPVW